MLDSGLCDVVIVSSPNMTHHEILMDIIAHPKPHHVLVEKPLCTTVAHCKEVHQSPYPFLFLSLFAFEFVIGFGVSLNCRIGW